MVTKTFAGAACMLLMFGVAAGQRAGAGEAGWVEGAAVPEFTPGDRIIARALYSAQPRYAGVPGSRWTLKQLVVARDDGRDWDAIFQDMKAAGLVRGAGLGDVLSAYLRPETIKKVLNEESFTGIGDSTPDGAPVRLDMQSNRDQGSRSGAAASFFASGVDSAAGGMPAGQRGGVGGGHGHGRGR